MGKKIALVLLSPTLLALSLFSFLFFNCSHEGQNKIDAVSAATPRKGPTAPVYLNRYMHTAMTDGIVKIAVLVNLAEGDNSRQIIEGCVAEGRAMGFTVDAFVSGGDQNKCREIAAGIARADYDGLIFAYGSVDFSYDILKPIADKGIQIVTFEALPYRDGSSIDGLITTFQDDYRLSHLSLDTLLSYCNNVGRPARVIRVGCDPGITFLDRRSWEFEQLLSDRKIEQAAYIRMASLENPRNAAREALAAVLPRISFNSVDAIWVPWNEFAAGCVEALAAADRQDIKLISIGISNDDIRLMIHYPQVWLATTTIDLNLAGMVNMRLIAASLAGETLKSVFSFDPQLIRTSDLNPTANIFNIPMMVPGWLNGSGLFDQYPWMNDLKGAEERHLRIAPAASTAASGKSP